MPPLPSPPVNFVVINCCILNHPGEISSVERLVCTPQVVIPRDKDTFFNGVETAMSTRVAFASDAMKQKFRLIINHIHDLLWHLSVGSLAIDSRYGNNVKFCILEGGLEATVTGELAPADDGAALPVQHHLDAVRDLLHAEEDTGFFVQVLHWYMCLYALNNPEHALLYREYAKQGFHVTHARVTLNCYFKTFMSNSRCCKNMP